MDEQKFAAEMSEKAEARPEAHLAQRTSGGADEAYLLRQSCAHVTSATTRRAKCGTQRRGAARRGAEENLLCNHHITKHAVLTYCRQ